MESYAYGIMLVSMVAITITLTSYFQYQHGFLERKYFIGATIVSWFFAVVTFTAGAIGLPIIYIFPLVCIIICFYAMFKNSYKITQSPITGHIFITLYLSVYLIAWTLTIDVYHFMGLNNVWLFAGFMCLYIFLVYLVNYLFYYFNKKFHILATLQLVKKKYTAVTTTYHLLICILLVIRTFAFYHNPLLYTSTTLMLTLIAFLIIALYTYLKFLKQKDYLIKQTTANKRYKSLYDETAAFRHDYKSLLFSLRLLIREGENQKALSMLDELEDYSSKQLSRDQAYLDLEKINIPSIKSLLINLFRKAEESGVKINFSTKTWLNHLEMEEFDYVRCISILINNAVEASSELPNAEIQIQFKQRKDGFLNFTVTNPVAETAHIQVERLIERGYSTKNTHQGLGLTTINKICKQYNGADIILIRKTNIFEATLITKS